MMRIHRILLINIHFKKPIMRHTPVILEPNHTTHISSHPPLQATDIHLRIQFLEIRINQPLLVHLHKFLAS
jgi:hypothetical protein